MKEYFNCSSLWSNNSNSQIHRFSQEPTDDLIKKEYSRSRTDSAIQTSIRMTQWFTIVLVLTLADLVWDNTNEKALAMGAFASITVICWIVILLSKRCKSSIHSLGPLVMTLQFGCYYYIMCNLETFGTDFSNMKQTFLEISQRMIFMYFSSSLFLTKNLKQVCFILTPLFIVYSLAFEIKLLTLLHEEKKESDAEHSIGSTIISTFNKTILVMWCSFIFFERDATVSVESIRNKRMR